MATTNQPDLSAYESRITCDTGAALFKYHKGCLQNGLDLTNVSNGSAEDTSNGTLRTILSVLNPKDDGHQAIFQCAGWAMDLQEKGVSLDQDSSAIIAQLKQNAIAAQEQFMDGLCVGDVPADQVESVVTSSRWIERAANHWERFINDTTEAGAWSTVVPEE